MPAPFLCGLAEHNWHPGVSRPIRRQKRFAGVVVGSVGEQEFERSYNALSVGQEFKLADQTKEGTDTDYLTVDAKERPAFRVTVKMYGSRFYNSLQFVGLEPEDTFGVATYKIRAAVRKSQREALPYLFAIASNEALRADAVAETLPDEVAHLLDTSTLYVGPTGWKTVEDRLVDLLLDPTGFGSSPTGDRTSHGTRRDGLSSHQRAEGERPHESAAGRAGARRLEP
jgi:hypothetical protein